MSEPDLIDIPKPSRRPGQSTRATWVPKKNPVEPASWDRHVAYAMRALRKGEATPDQQQLCLDWLEYVSGTGHFEDLSFRPGGPEGERLTAFSEGKRSVGLQIRKLLSPAIDGRIEKEIADEAKAEKRTAREQERELE